MFNILYFPSFSHWAHSVLLFSTFFLIFLWGNKGNRSKSKGREKDDERSEKKKYIKEKVLKGSDGIIVKFFFFYNKPTPYLDHKSYENFCMFYENLQFCDSVSLRILTTDRSDQSYYFVIFICNIIFIHYKVKVLTIKFIVYTICFYCSIVIQWDFIVRVKSFFI